ncbi:unnamed protein product [Miscanthus lutarioriparius]|uniref:AT3G52170-like helix-turn-helix domain-containing protein n=1 Tax=Miscanthus lutarioriparius TaxID=422564 RepID=A0A811PW70_9POAL|nr:unnamed protein product [Miscanthus lutarioriparius]
MQASARLSSSAAFRKVIAGVSSATTRSCYRTSRGKAHAAPLPAQEPPPKGRKRISMQERRALIVEFVDNYRASNEGKFPTITNICEQIGGSFYTVRPVIQEMVYNHAKLPLDNPKPVPRQVTVEVTEHLMQKDEARVAQRQVSEPSTPKDDAEVAHLMQKDEARVAERQVSVHSTPKDDAEMAHLMQKDEPRVAERQVSEHAFPKDEGKVLCREDNPKLEESVNTGLLGSLKSFAYGIRNFWKNM